MNSAAPSKSLGRILLARAFWVLLAFTGLLLVSFPAVPSDPPYFAPNLIPALAVLVLGAATWLLMLVSCIRAFRSAEARPSALSAISFFVFFGCELLLAADALRHL